MNIIPDAIPRQRAGSRTVRSWRHLCAYKDTSVKVGVRFVIFELKMNICHLVKTL